MECEYVCTRKCFYDGQLWEVGKTLIVRSPEEAAKLPRHFMVKPSETNEEDIDIFS